MAEPIRFFFDQHIPAAVAQGLRQRGIEVLTAQEAGRCGLPDAAQLQLALAEDRVLVTIDSDFLALAADWPVPEDWVGVVNAPQTAGHLALAHTLRRCGRPRKMNPDRRPAQR